MVINLNVNLYFAKWITYIFIGILYDRQYGIFTFIFEKRAHICVRASHIQGLESFTRAERLQLLVQLWQIDALGSKQYLPMNKSIVYIHIHVRVRAA